MNLKKLLTWAIVIFLIFYLATHPASSAHILRHLYNGLNEVAHSLSKFVDNLHL